jgi:SAM-dependent methyltransferase
MSIHTAVQWGDFTSEAAPYSKRPPYDHSVLTALSGLARSQGEPVVAELGAGTGNLLRSLDTLGLGGFAIEPNETMRSTAAGLASPGSRFSWRSGTGESTGLDASSVDWIIIGNAFQFMAPADAIVEFSRILRNTGQLTIVWLLRDFARDQLQQAIEQRLRERFPTIRRISGIIDTLMQPVLTSGLFKNTLYLEAHHSEHLSPERLLSVWMADHDAPSQIERDEWGGFIEDIRNWLPKTESLETQWYTRCWVFRPVMRGE